MCNVDANDEYFKILKGENEDSDKSIDPRIEYLDKYKPYFTEKGLISLRNNRFIDIYRKAVLSEEGSELRLHSITFLNISYNADEKKFVVDYTVGLHLINDHTGETKEFEELNQAILIKENGHWKIRRDTIHIDRDMIKLLKSSI